MMFYKLLKSSNMILCSIWKSVPSDSLTIFKFSEEKEIKSHELHCIKMFPSNRVSKMSYHQGTFALNEFCNRLNVPTSLQYLIIHKCSL